VRRALGGRPGVEVVVTGMGQAAAARAAAAWVGRVRGVVVCGVAGGVGGAAGAGDVVVASAVLDAAGTAVGPVVVVEVPGAVVGAVASVESAVDGDGSRAGLRALGAVAAETEAASWVRAGAAAGVPVAVVRCVLDTPELPLGAAASLVRVGAAAPSTGDLARVALQPAAWGSLLRLGRRAGAAERRAAEAGVQAAVALAGRG
jgi:nucleoside phosphorylase